MPHNALHYPSRRAFMRASAAWGAGFWAGARSTAWLRGPAAIERRLNLGFVGPGSCDLADQASASGENVVALCDGDIRRLRAACLRFPDATGYSTVCELLAHERVDALVVSAPGYSHAFPIQRALDAGLHVYSGLPLARSLREIRDVADRFARAGTVTQAAFPGHGDPSTLRTLERLESGAIGPVRRVRLTAAPESAGGFLSPVYALFHFASRALCLGQPVAISVTERSSGARGSAFGCVVHYEFEARGVRPPVQLDWHHVYVRRNPPPGASGAQPREDLLFRGDGGRLATDLHGHALQPHARFAELEPPPPYLRQGRSPLQEWIDACKSGGPTSCSFDYACPLTTSVLQGGTAMGLYALSTGSARAKGSRPRSAPGLRPAPRA